MRRVTVISGTAAAAVALGASVAFAVTFVGADRPDSPAVLIPPGASGTVHTTMENTGGPLAGGGNWILDFIAPANTMFTSASLPPTQVSTDGGATYSNGSPATWTCTLGGGGATMQCTSNQGASWPSGLRLRWSPTITVNPSAPANTSLTGGTLVARFDGTGAQAGTHFDTPAMTMNVSTPAETQVPMINGLAAIALLAVPAIVMLGIRRRSHSVSMAT